MVGADRIAANGDVANKVGTYPLAVLAARHGIPFHVAAPVSTLDPATRHGRGHPDRGARPGRGAGRRRAGGIRGAQPGLRRDPGRAGGRGDHRGRRAAGALPGGDRARWPADGRRAAALRGAPPALLGIGGGGDVVGRARHRRGLPPLRGRAAGGRRGHLGAAADRSAAGPAPRRRRSRTPRSSAPGVLWPRAGHARARERRALRRGADGRVPRRAHGARGRERAARRPLARGLGAAAERPRLRPDRAAWTWAATPSPTATSPAWRARSATR